MRFLSIVHSSILGGANVSLIILLEGLKNKGWQPHIVVPQEGYLTEKLKELKIPYFIVPHSLSVWPQCNNMRQRFIFPLIFFRFLYGQWKAKRKIKQIVEKNNIELIHTNVSVSNLGYLIAKELKLPHVWHIREYGDKDFNFNFFPSKRTLINRLNAGHAISITKDLKNNYGNSYLTEVIYNPFLISNVPVNFNIRENKFIYVGAVADGKGVEEIIDSFYKFSQCNREYTLEIIGSAPINYQQYLSEKIRKYNITHRIFFMGEKRNIHEEMQRSKAIIIASRCEGFGRIMPEAMINKCLVIAKNTGGLKEQFDNGRTVTGKEIGFRYNTTEELVEQMKAIARIGETEYKEIAERAYHPVKELYNAEKCINLTAEKFHATLYS